MSVVAFDRVMPPAMRIGIVGALALALACGCGGSSSETPPPLDPGITSREYTGPRVSRPGEPVAPESEPAPAKAPAAESPATGAN